MGYDGVSEHVRNVTLQRAILTKSQSLQMNAFIITDPIDATLRDVIHMVNEDARKGDYLLDIHFNPNINATGTEVFVHPETSRKNKAIATDIVYETSRMMSIPIRRATKRRDYKYPVESHVGRLAIIEDTVIPAILWEVCFLNQNDLTRLTTYTHNQLARMIPDIYMKQVKRMR